MYESARENRQENDKNQIIKVFDYRDTVVQ